MEEPTSGTRPRPLQVTLAAWLVIVPTSIGAGIGIVLSITDPARVGIEDGAYATTFSVAFLATVAALFAWLGVSLLRLRRWARPTAIVLEAVVLLLWLPQLADGTFSIAGAIWQGLLPLTVIVLLAPMRSAFEA